MCSFIEFRKYYIWFFNHIAFETILPRASTVLYQSRFMFLVERNLFQGWVQETLELIPMSILSILTRVVDISEINAEAHRLSSLAAIFSLEDLPLGACRLVSDDVISNFSVSMDFCSPRREEVGESDHTYFAIKKHYLDLRKTQVLLSTFALH